MIKILVPDNTPAGEYGISPVAPPVIPEVPPIVVIPPPVFRYPVGKGWFIWQPQATEGGNPVLAAKKAKAAGIKWVTLKIHERDGTYPFPFSNIDLVPWVTAFKNEGIEVWGWGYVYGDKPEAEANIAVQRLVQLGLRGYFIDAETEYKGKHAQASRFIHAFRSKSNLPMGLCSFRYPDVHPTIPWREFLLGCDFHAPQVYPLGNISATGFGLQLTRSVAQLRLRAQLPVIPIGPACKHPVRTFPTSILARSFPHTGHVYDNGDIDVTWEPTVTQLNDFHNTAVSMNLPGDGWWSWQAALPQWWDAIAAHR